MFQTVMQSLAEGFLKTLEIFALTLAGAIPLGFIIAFGSMSRFKVLSFPVKFIVWIVRGTPLMLQLLIIYYGPGLLLGNNWWGSGSSGRFIAAMVAFIFNYACYFSEIFRGGIEGVPRGQREAGQVLGMTNRQIFFQVTLMQVVKRIVPPMGNEVITLVKDTSLAFSISYVEMFTIAKQIAAAKTTMVPFVAAGIFYYIFNFVVAWVMELLEKKFSYYH